MHRFAVRAYQRLYINEAAGGRYDHVLFCWTLEQLQLKRINVYLNEVAGSRYASRASLMKTLLAATGSEWQLALGLLRWEAYSFGFGRIPKVHVVRGELVSRALVLTPPSMARTDRDNPGDCNVQSVVGKSSTSLALAVVVHSSSDGPDLEVDTVGETAADEAVKQNGDLGDHAAREFIAGA